MASNEEIIRKFYMRSQRRNTRSFGRCSPRTATGGTSRLGPSTSAIELARAADIYSTAFPDMHRELHDLYFDGDVVVVATVADRDP